MDENVSISLDGLSVVIGMPTTRDIPALTAKSLVQTVTACGHHNVPYGLAMVVGNAVIQWARDEVIQLFLDSDANRLFMIDSDIVWESNDFMRLLALSQKRDVVCATYPAKHEPIEYYVHHDEEKGLEQGEFGLVEIYGVGLGFTVITREVAQKLYDSAPLIHDQISDRDIPQIFRVGASENGIRQGEDMAFFSDIRKLGYKVYLDPSIHLGHIGTKVYTKQGVIDGTC